MAKLIFFLEGSCAVCWIGDFLLITTDGINPLPSLYVVVMLHWAYKGIVFLATDCGDFQFNQMHSAKESNHSPRSCVNCSFNSGVGRSNNELWWYPNSSFPVEKCKWDCGTVSTITLRKEKKPGVFNRCPFGREQSFLFSLAGSDYLFMLLWGLI